jgi:hypothetical protein
MNGEKERGNLIKNMNASIFLIQNEMMFLCVQVGMKENKIHFDN